MKYTELISRRACAFFLTLFFFISHGTSQVFADFEDPEIAPVLENGHASIVDNPDQSGINNSSKCASYDKTTGNWHYISMLFDNPLSFEDNTILKFKMYSTVRGR